MTTPMTIPDAAVQAAHAEYHKVLGDSNRSNPMLAALTAALPFLQRVKVKALSWNEYNDEQGIPDRWDAVTVTGEYYFIGLRSDGYTVSFNYFDIGTFNTLEAAKSAAQADYEARILSALEPFANSYPQGANLAAHSKNESGPDHEPSPREQGLEIVSYEVFYAPTREWTKTTIPNYYRENDNLVRELVTRSQAEAIIAAEREEALKLIHDLERLKDHETQLLVDNAALTARVKEWEADVSAYILSAEDQDKQRKALETQLAAAKKALEWYEEHVSNCRKIGSIGAPSRAKLDRDGGAIARAALEDRP